MPVLVVGVLLASQSPRADPGPQLLHPLFHDHAVLQRGRPIQVYGETAPAFGCPRSTPVGLARLLPVRTV